MTSDDTVKQSTEETDSMKMQLTTVNQWVHDQDEALDVLHERSSGWSFART